MTLRIDHVIGATAVAFGALVIALSGELPVGSLSFPGAGLWPKLLALLMIAFGIAMIAGAHASDAFSTIGWRDARHAAPVLAIATIAVVCYATLGFLISMGVMLFALVLLKGRPVAHAALYGAALSVATYALFTMVLRAPLPRGLLGF